MSNPFDPRRFDAALKAVGDIDLPDDATASNLTSPTKRKLREQMAQLRTRLDNLERMIDGAAVPSYTFDLSNPVTVGEMIAFKLSAQSRHNLPALKRFYGAGVYMLYYHGPFRAYKAISGTECPIYVGSASPVNKIADTPKKQKFALHVRLTHHLNRGIAKADNLDQNDFSCRYLVVQSGLELAAEQFLLRRFKPVWNKEMGICAGFGKHGDKEGRGDELSKWDLLHPGRSFSKGQKVKNKPRELQAVTSESLVHAITAHYQRLLREDFEVWSAWFNPAWTAEQAVSSLEVT